MQYAKAMKEIGNRKRREKKKMYKRARATNPAQYLNQPTAHFPSNRNGTLSPRWRVDPTGQTRLPPPSEFSRQ
jgi:hypothetical protein